ncbi:Fungal specific transcription factor, putative [Coccidioides posadasii C735 delta SOWgp]|uniref:Fungal specific transcription factor, putative n=1 Tax=Coccidioides posadasii (strain C735) TaxID=222929 RepID=C5P8K4_COCP7|nr:Fungal specific transcription factor, putative [Coccidioides posadasii C735 delta SOWgp]EER26066.1 Fungal specific transcription factor, putative [Coccidioides posadasii C735 delta SOWgp]|eukprot:XP_003068211.1 Fungal specific transcription factor, putative [Coccidioides posadasii C735 delta SOWgp]
MFKLPDREEYLSNLPKGKRAAPEGFDIASIRLIPSSEKKIETIDERLTSIERLLQDLALSIPTSSQAPPNTRQSSDHSRQNDGAKVRSVIQKSEATTPSAHFEGESALSAHSVLASAIFEQTMGSSPNIEQNPAMIQALSSLRDIVKGQTRPYHYPIFFLTVPMLDLPSFTQLCKDLYFCTDEYSSAQFATVNCALSYLFKEYTYYGPNGTLKDKFNEYSDMCRLNFETIISSFDLFVEPNYDNILALAFGAFHATELSKTSLCWNFTAVAARMCQSLGYHRTFPRRDESGGDTPTNVTRERSLFWFIYMMDKSMSLCLGRTSTLQDYDIAVEYPELPDDPGLRPWRLLYQYWTEYSKIVGRVYELLFSARALCDSAAERSRKAQKLEEEIKDWRTTMARFEPGDAYHAFFFGWMIPGADLSYYLLLTLVYRALPPTQPPETPSGLSLLCVEAARRALQLHQHVMLTFRAKDTYVMKGYVDWTILQCPFVPFLVIFCHTISSGDLDDLKLLEEVATSLQAAGSLSEGAERLYRLCMVFYQVAKVYVDAKRQEAENTNTTSEYQPIAYPGEQFDSYLNALGLGPSLAPSMLRGHADIGNNDGVEVIPELFDVEMAQSLEDWYLGNRHMMGLLESDF